MSIKQNCTFLLALVLFGGNTVQANVRVFACEPEWAALAEEIAGELVEATSATNALQDPHYIQARPSLIVDVRKADLLVCSGSDLEAGWLPLLLRKGNNPRVQPGQPGNLMASEYVTRLEIPLSVDRAQGDVHAQGNPHIQTDPRNLATVAVILAERLGQVDAVNKARYEAGLTAFQTRWSEAITRWERQAAPLRGKKIVPHHKSWAYLSHWLGLEEVTPLESKSGVPPSAAHLSNLLEQLRASPADVIIRTPYQDARPSEWLSQRAGIPEVVLPFTVGGTAQATDLYSLFEVTVRLLLKSTAADHE